MSRDRWAKPVGARQLVILPPKKDEWWRPIVHFLTHTIVGSAIFLLVALPAVMLHLLVHELQNSWGITGYVNSVLTWLEDFIVSIDALGLAIFLLVAMWKAVKEWIR